MKQDISMASYFESPSKNKKAQMTEQPQSSAIMSKLCLFIAGIAWTMMCMYGIVLHYRYTQQNQQQHFQYDLVITTGYRQMYGATLASTLSSLAFSGALQHAASRHLVMADKRVMGLSLIQNLLSMPSLQSHIASEQPQQHISNSTRITYHAALVAPDELHPSALPSLIMEDDIWLIDDFGRKLMDVVASAAKQAQGQPFFMSIYKPEWSSGSPLEVRARHLNDLPPKNSTDPYRAELVPYSSCTQALFFSDGALRRRLADYYLNQIRTSPDRPLQDIPILEFLNKHNVLQFYPDRSLVQHTGASSAIFGGGSSNRRFHRAVDFPFVERYVVEDNAADWAGCKCDSK